MKIKLTPKQKKKLKRALKQFSNDLSYSNGGWLFFIGRMSVNVVILYYVMQFLLAFYMFTFSSVQFQEGHLETMRTVLWTIGLLYVVIKGFTILERPGDKK